MNVWINWNSIYLNTSLNIGRSWTREHGAVDNWTLGFKVNIWILEPWAKPITQSYGMSKEDKTLCFTFLASRSGKQHARGERESCKLPLCHNLFRPVCTDRLSSSYIALQLYFSTNAKQFTFRMQVMFLQYL